MEQHQKPVIDAPVILGPSGRLKDIDIVTANISADFEFPLTAGEPGFVGWQQRCSHF